MTRLHFLLIALVTGAIGYSALWFTVAFELENKLDAELAALEAAGYSTRKGPMKVGGFPYRLEASLEDLRIQAPDGALRAHMDEAVAVSHLWTPNHWVIEATGVNIRVGDTLMSLRDPFARMSIRTRPTTGTAVVMDFNATRAGSNGPELSLLGGDRVALSDALISFRFGPVGAQQSELYAASLFDVFLRLEGPHLSLETRASITGERMEPLTQEGIASWRDAGGLIEFHQLGLRAGDTRFTGNGSLSFDERMRPLGSFSGMIKGGSKDLMEALGLERAADADNQTLEVMVQNGTVVANGTVVGRVPALD